MDEKDAASQTDSSPKFSEPETRLSLSEMWKNHVEIREREQGDKTVL